MSRAAHSDAFSDPLADRLWDMVTEQAAPDAVKSVLLNDFDAVARVMTTPGYVQPNGFLTFKLGGQNGDRLLRLHYWPEGLPESGESAGIHDHVFDFTSLVLGGDAPMINTVYDIEEDAASAKHLYEVDYTNPRQSKINCLGKHFAGIARKTEIIPRSHYYAMKAGEFHTSQIWDNQEAFTLLASRLNPAVTKPRFLSSTFDQTEYTRPPLTDAHRHHVAQRLAALVKSP